MVFDLQKNLDEAVPIIKALMQKCESKPIGTTQPTVDEICIIALRHKVATKVKVRHYNAGIHRKNRGGSGVDPFNGQKLTRKITYSGFSFNKLENPMGFEKATGEEGKLQDEFMKKIGRKAMGI